MIIKAPSRIHMSLIDLNGSYRRIDGGIGVALADPQFILEIQKRDDKMVTLEFSDDVDDPEAILECSEKIPEAAQKTIDHFKIDEGFHFIVHQTYPPHSGFGSGTQIAISTAHLITETMGIEIESRLLSSIVGRGGTSGIGTYGFEDGGFIADGGHSLKEKATFLPSSASSACPPPLIGRYDRYSKYNKKNIARYIGEKKDIPAVSYNTLFFESANEGGMGDYFLKFRKSLISSSDRNANFVEEVANAADRLVLKVQEVQMMR